MEATKRAGRIVRRVVGAGAMLVGAFGLAGAADAGNVQAYGHLIDISTFNVAATRPRLDRSQIVEFTFAVERVISSDLEEPVGQRLTMYLPLADVVEREDVLNLQIGDRTYVTLNFSSPVTDFRFHPHPEPDPDQ